MARRRLAAVFAHPDDDTFGVSGSIALLGPGGLTYTAIVATSGEAGEIAEDSGATRETLAAVREDEERAALAAAGFAGADVHFLRHPDGGLDRVDAEALTQHVADLLRAASPEVVVSFGPEGGTGHADHIAISRVTTEAFHRCRAEGPAGSFLRLCYTAIPQRDVDGYRESQRARGIDPGPPDAPFALRGVPDDTIGVTVDATSVIEGKLAAIRAHRTQADGVPDIPEELLPFAFGYEHFVIAWPERPPGGPLLPDLFAGLDA